MIDDFFEWGRGGAGECKKFASLIDIEFLGGPSK